MFPPRWPLCLRVATTLTWLGVVTPQGGLGNVALFYGPTGTGKSRAAEAVGYELGRSLSVMSCSEVLSIQPSTSNRGRSPMSRLFSVWRVLHRRARGKL